MSPWAPRPPAAPEDVIRSLFPALAPATLKAALACMYVMVALFVVDLLTTAVFATSGEVVVVDLLFAAAFLYLGVALGRAANWARYVVVGLAVLLLLSSFSLFRTGVIGLVQVVGVVQIIALGAVIVLLLLPSTNWWFRAPKA